MLLQKYMYVFVSESLHQWCKCGATYVGRMTRCHQCTSNSHFMQWYCYWSWSCNTWWNKFILQYTTKYIHLQWNYCIIYQGWVCRHRESCDGMCSVTPYFSNPWNRQQLTYLADNVTPSFGLFDGGSSSNPDIPGTTWRTNLCRVCKTSRWPMLFPFFPLLFDM